MKVLNFFISQTQYLQAQCNLSSLVFLHFVRLCLRLRLIGVGFVAITGLASPVFADSSAVIDLHKVVHNQASEPNAQVPTQAQIQSGRDAASRFLLPDFRDEYGVPAIISHPPLPSVEERVNKLTAATEANLAEAQIVLEQAQQSLDDQGVGIQLVGEQSDGSIIVLDGIDDAGRLIFLTTTSHATQSLDAAKTVSADELWPGGSTGYNLDGTGTRIGIWEVGAHPLTTHQEFVSEGVSRAIIIDGGDNIITSRHATEVNSVVIAAGVNADAKGMAFDGTSHSYETRNAFPEMMAAAEDGLLISNHSYEQRTGWRWYSDILPNGAWIWFGDTRISAVEDWRFGFYGEYAQRVDQITYQNPNYLSVWAAGNNRGERGPAAGGIHVVEDIDRNRWVWSNAVRQPDGGVEGYDSLAVYQTSKNSLVVGSVADIPDGYGEAADVRVSAFSSFGPTDDGRIKPDLVANGESLLMANDASNQGYSRASGTSFAAPSTTGSLALALQYHTNSVSETPMHSATLRGLAIHTAKEAGNALGPDYKHGWGLFNAVACVELSDANQASSTGVAYIKESRLPNGEAISFPVLAKGGEPLKVTIVWTDPPYSDAEGNTLNDALDPEDVMLVNDLDLRVRAEDDTVHLPWVLDPANPANAATTGDNLLDNVEQVSIAAPDANARYTVTINHKGTLREPVLILAGELGFEADADKYRLEDAIEGQSLSILISGVVAPDRRPLKATNSVYLSNSQEFYFDWPSEVGKRYKIQASDDLESFGDISLWMDAIEIQTGITLSIDDNSAHKFYRVVEEARVVTEDQ